MGVSDYGLYLQRPIIKKLKHAKQFWDVILIVLCGVGAVLLLNTLEDLEPVLGNVFLAAGSLPFLLSLPLAMARISITFAWRKALDGRRYTSLLFTRDITHALAYFFYFVSAAIGVYLIYSGNDNDADALKESFAEILAEVAVIYSITTVLQVPAVYDDVTKALLTYRENLQLERSGCLSSPWAPAVDQCLSGDYHDDLRYFYPDEIAVGYVEDYFSTPKSSPPLPRGKDTTYTGPEHAIEATRLINNHPPGWDSPFFVAALGRCIVEFLGGEIHAKLLACISGAAPYIDRFIVQSAVTSLGHLYFETGNSKISHRLLQLWLSHEVSNVRDHCVTSLKAIKHATLVPLLDQLVNPGSITTVDIAKAYYSDCGIDTAPLLCTSLKDMCVSLQSTAATTRTMTLVAACALTTTSSPHAEANMPYFKDFIEIMQKSIVLDPLEGHAVKALALEVIVRMLGVYKELKATCPLPVQAIAWQLGLFSLRTSVYKSVRAAGQKVLSAAEYPHLYLFKCFDTEATSVFRTEGVTVDAIAKVLQKWLPPQEYSSIQQKARNLVTPEVELGEKFSNAAVRSTTVSDETDPSLMLYAKLITSPAWTPKDTFIQERLNSDNRLERYVALVCIGRLCHRKSFGKMKKEVVPAIATSELISSVRDLAVVVLAEDHGGLLDRLCCCGDQESSGDRRVRLVERERMLLQKRMQ
eukprot:m.237896 g.237896  ORF g.237896 m.237896 type:complete len:697 (-) comp19379_c1_seq20:455-2545(-)